MTCQPAVESVPELLCFRVCGLPSDRPICSSFSSCQRCVVALSLHLLAIMTEYEPGATARVDKDTTYASADNFLVATNITMGAFPQRADIMVCHDEADAKLIAADVVASPARVGTAAGDLAAALGRVVKTHKGQSIRMLAKFTTQFADLLKAATATAHGADLVGNKEKVQLPMLDAAGVVVGLFDGDVEVTAAAGDMVTVAFDRGSGVEHVDYNHAFVRASQQSGGVQGLLLKMTRSVLQEVASIMVNRTIPTPLLLLATTMGCFAPRLQRLLL